MSFPNVRCAAPEFRASRASAIQRGDVVQRALLRGEHAAHDVGRFVDAVDLEVAQPRILDADSGRVERLCVDVAVAQLADDAWGRAALACA